ncbi:uncharacterized protein C8R40DRAFT_1252614, partial [Lentinula edodes]|uniref:uncharacterized protein n=1 Tax=Lentinula edodes TaxID=5353 RepID=UPI001E8D8AAA
MEASSFKAFDGSDTMSGIEYDHTVDLDTRQRRPKRSMVDKVKLVLHSLRDAHLSPTEFISNLYNSKYQEFDFYKQKLFEDGNHKHLHQLLDSLWADPRGQNILKSWMHTPAIEYSAACVSREFEAVKPHLQMYSQSVSANYMQSWSLERIVEPLLMTHLPVWSHILRSASETKESQDSGGLKSHQRNMVAQVAHTRSQACAKIQLGLGMYAWATGASKSLLEVMHRASLTPSYTTIGKTWEHVGNTSIQTAILVANEYPTADAWDNVNLSTSGFVEQRPDAPSRVQSGTLPVIYKLHNAAWEDMLLKPMTDKLKASSNLMEADIAPTEDQLESYMHQACINIIEPLTKYIEGFNNDKYKRSSTLQHKERRPLPRGLKTDFYPLRLNQHEEASVNGNLLVQDDIHLNQLKQEDDTNPWTRREIYQNGMGILHFLMNLVWVVLHTYRGEVQQIGSLRNFFVKLEKKRLDGDKPDYYTLLSAFDQILDGLLLHAWQKQCGFPNLTQFATSQPSPECLLKIAARILQAYASPMEEPLQEMDEGSEDSNDSDSVSPEFDPVLRNVQLLIRDLLYVREIVQATSAGDFGRIEDLFPDMLRIFRGAGSNNYSTEILHWIHRVKNMWTPAFA